MAYLDRIERLKEKLDGIGSLIRLDAPYVAGRRPTQASSEFLTNKEQGDWAEQTFIKNFNQLDGSLWATRYGRSEDLAAGDPGFDAYYQEYQKELEDIGKRPDVLIFEKSLLMERSIGLVPDISRLSREALDQLVPLAKAAIEVRSSSFLSLKYRAESDKERARLKSEVDTAAAELLKKYSQELKQFAPVWLEYVERIGTGTTVPPSRVLARNSTERLRCASDLTKHIKGNLKLLDQRRSLSITPKAEDMSLVYRWIRKYGVPHHYCQVFFDRAVLISFENILDLLSKPEREEVDYFIEQDVKNQGKTTFKINVDLGNELMRNISLPEHSSAMKELPMGRLLFYVRFKPSQATFSTLELTGA